MRNKLLVNQCPKLNWRERENVEYKPNHRDVEEKTSNNVPHVHDDHEAPFL